MGVILKKIRCLNTIQIFSEAFYSHFGWIFETFGKLSDLKLVQFFFESQIKSREVSRELLARWSFCCAFLEAH